MFKKHLTFHIFYIVLKYTLSVMLCLVLVFKKSLLTKMCNVL